VPQVELYQNDDAEDVARVFCINHRIGDPECAKLLEVHTLFDPASRPFC